MCIEPPRPARDAVVAAEQLGHDVVGVGAARQRVAVRAVGRDQVVLVAHRAHRADDRRLLADREVQEAADLRLRVHLARALLEAADEHHRLEPLARGVRLGKLARLARPGLRLGHVHSCLDSSASEAALSVTPSAATWRGTRPPRAARGRRAARAPGCPVCAGGVSQNSDDLAGGDLDAPRRGRARRARASSAGPRPLVCTISSYARLALIATRRGRARARGRRGRRAPSIQTAGTSSTPAAAAARVASSRRSAIERELRALDHRGRVHLARGGGDQDVVALGRGRARPRRPGGSAASENATPRPICFA